MGNTFFDKMRHTVTVNTTPFAPEEMANEFLHPVVKEAITKYKQLIDDPLMRDVWLKTMCKEQGRLTQRYGEKGSQYHTERTNIIRFLYHEGIGKIPRDR
jgi:hypothetical protein